MNDLTNPPSVSVAQQWEESPPSLAWSQPEKTRQIGFAAGGFATVSNVAPARPENVAPATKKRGPGHISGHVSAPGSETVSNADWSAVRVPDRGEGKSYFSGPIFWKFRTDRECWRVEFKAAPDAHAVNLGNLGKRELAALDALPDQRRTSAILDKLREWMAEKGISL